MLSPEELVSLRGVARASLPGRCNHTRVTRVRQPNGTFRDVTTTIASDVECRKVATGQTPEERQVLEGTQLTSRGVATFIMDSSNAVYRDDVIVYGGKKYGVIGVLTRTDGEYVRVMVYDDSAAVPAS